MAVDSGTSADPFSFHIQPFQVVADHPETGAAEAEVASADLAAAVVLAAAAREAIIKLILIFKETVQEIFLSGFLYSYKRIVLACFFADY